MRSLGVVRRIILLSRSLVGNIGASLKKAKEPSSLYT
jgi:hypothetical protein